MRRAWKWAGWILFGLFVLMCLAPLLEWPFQILFGWIYFLFRTVPQMRVEPAALVVAAAALVLVVGISHYLARWLYNRPAADAAIPARKWRFRWTLTAVSLVVCLFAAGIAVTVTIHEGVWLMSSPEPWFGSGAMEAARRASSINKLKQMGLALHQHHSEHDRFPAGGTFNQYGEMQHSWETALLPYMECPQVPHPELPWNHPDNAKLFKAVLVEFINPAEPGDTRDAQGYGLSHYSANSRVFGPNTSPRFTDISDGLSTTIAVGEVRANFKPWGHPVNWRDPAEGVQRSPDGFGGPYSSGVTQFLMMDGSVRTVSPKIDPGVLKALATPAGGETLPSEDQWERE